MIRQLGGGWGGSAWPRNEAAIPLGVQAALAVDPEQMLFGHLITGSDRTHIRPVQSIEQPAADVWRFVGRDGTVYIFERDLEPPLDVVWRNWQESASTHAPDVDVIDADLMNKDFASDYLTPEG